MAKIVAFDSDYVRLALPIHHCIHGTPALRVATRLNNHYVNGVDKSSPESVDRALTVLLRALLNPSMAQSSEALHANPINRLQYCIEQTRLEASEGASLVAACAPQGRAMFSQAQRRLEHLESLQLLVIGNGFEQGHQPS